MKRELELLEFLIAASRRKIAQQEQLVLRLHEQGQPDLAEMAQEHLEKVTADLEDLRELRRRALSDLRRPRASSRPPPAEEAARKRG